MEYTVKALTEAMSNRIEDSMALEYERQLRVSYERGELYSSTSGKVRYDIGAIDLAYSVVLDEVDRELEGYVMREKITEDDKDDIMDSL